MSNASRDRRQIVQQIAMCHRHSLGIAGRPGGVLEKRHGVGAGAASAITRSDVAGRFVGRHDDQRAEHCGLFCIELERCANFSRGEGRPGPAIANDGFESLRTATRPGWIRQARRWRRRRGSRRMRRHSRARWDRGATPARLRRPRARARRQRGKRRAQDRHRSSRVRSLRR